VVVAYRSMTALPPVRRLIEIDSEAETLGQTLRRLRLERNWSQRYVAQSVGEEDNSIVSKWERDSLRPRAEMLETLEDLFEQPRDSLAVIAHRADVQRERRERIPGPGILVGPVEPEFIEAVRALFLLEPEDLPDAAERIRSFAKGPLPRVSEDEEAAS
jgi:transcriptional regulator with XRE-family HTH domain